MFGVCRRVFSGSGTFSETLEILEILEFLEIQDFADMSEV